MLQARHAIRVANNMPHTHGGVKMGRANRDEGIPHLSIQRFHSHGVAARVGDPSSPVALHFHSQLEFHTWLALRYDRTVIGMRSQVQLRPATETHEIALLLRITPPRLSRRNPVMTTDLCAFVRRDGQIRVDAYSCKYDADRQIRERELFDIAKEYWRRRGVLLEWRTELDLAPEHLRNFRMARKFRDPDSALAGNHCRRDELVDLLRAALHNGRLSLLEVCDAFDEAHQLEVATAMSLFWWAAEHRRWLDLTSAIRPGMRCAYLRWLA
jgi:hypothetical protein